MVVRYQSVAHPLGQRFSFQPFRYQWLSVAFPDGLQWFSGFRRINQATVDQVDDENYED